MKKITIYVVESVKLPKYMAFTNIVECVYGQRDDNHLDHDGFAESVASVFEQVTRIEVSRMGRFSTSNLRRWFTDNGWNYLDLARKRIDKTTIINVIELRKED